MNQNVKKNIRLLAEKYKHDIQYRERSILLTSSINQIEITQKDKYGFYFSYNPNLEGKKREVDFHDIYDVLIDLLSRREIYHLKPKNGNLLTIDDWIDGDGCASDKAFQKQFKELDQSVLEYKNLGGNRIEAEYYKGLIIIIDDLLMDKSNVIELKSLI
ncbi:MAG: hypothetical protein GQ574_04295 [Crocinitomix sp.]|nr:hypothetical protein [Crocinitomix sp.]